MRTAVAAVDPLLEQRLTEARTRLVRRPAGREALVRVLLTALFVVAATTLAAVADTHRHPAWWLYPAFAAGYALASSIAFELGSGSVLVTVLALVPMLFVLPARDVPLIVAAGLALAAAREVATGSLSLRRALMWPPVSSLHALGPAIVFVVAREPRADGRGAVVLAVAVAAQFALDAAVSCTLEWLGNDVRPRELVRPLAWTFAIDALLAPLGYLAAVGARVETAALLLPIPLAGIFALFARERRERLDSVLELSSAYRGTALLLGDVVEADDAYTGDHSRQVLDLVLEVADRLELDPQTRRLAEFTALLHDVGKIRIPAEIIGKPGPLTLEERAIMNTHTLEGERLLLRVGGLLGQVGRLVRSCHERWDGAGYPDGLAGSEIPLVARIVCCCDAYNAMTTDRPYRGALGHEAALAELVGNAGTQFDPQIVQLLLDILAQQAPVAEDRGLLACPSCGKKTMLDEPVQQMYRVCLGCGLVPVRVTSQESV
jgi:HD-GYP domain-containing protein (c-di-GMP phosphodiesterase class II)